MKLKLKYEKRGIIRTILYDVIEVFPVGDGLIGIEVPPSDKNFDSIAENTLNRVFSSSYGDSENYFKLVDVQNSKINENIILVLLKVV